jgi:integrase
MSPSLGAKMTLNEFVEIVWMRLEVTSKTLYNYKGGYRRYVGPVIGNLDISGITPTMVRECLIKLPNQTRYQTHMMLRSIFREAISEELINKSPMDGLRAPRVHPKQGKFLTWEELKDIDFGSHTNRIRFLALHGLRYGEAAALTEADIYDGFVHVTKSIHGQTKTRAGVRRVPYIGYFEPFPQRQCKLAKKLRPYGVKVHSLRKTYAYSLKSSSVHVTTAAKLLGHSNPMVTLQIYTGVRDEEIADSATRLISYLNLGKNEMPMLAK